MPRTPIVGENRAATEPTFCVACNTVAYVNGFRTFQTIMERCHSREQVQIRLAATPSATRCGFYFLLLMNQSSAFLFYAVFGFG